MGRRVFLVAGHLSTRHVCHRSLTVVGVIAPAYWTFGQSEYPDAWPSEHVQRQPPCQRDGEGGARCQGIDSRARNQAWSDGRPAASLRSIRRLTCLAFCSQGRASSSLSRSIRWPPMSLHGVPNSGSISSCHSFVACRKGARPSIFAVPLTGTGTLRDACRSTPARASVPTGLDHAALTSIVLGVAACGAGTLTSSMP